MVTSYHFTARSSNKKTGPIAVTTTSSDSCPQTCPFNNGGGCYAASGPLALHWRAVDRGERGGDWLHLSRAVADAKLPAGSLVRVNQAGDLPHIEGRINSVIVSHLADIFIGNKLRPFTYTHHLQNIDNLAIIKGCNDGGFTVNLSCESEAQASKRHREGFPTVCVVRSDDQRRSWTDADGVRFQTCPAQLKDGVTCQTCQLCTRAGDDRHCVVAFRSHGTGKRRIDAAL